VDKVQYLRDLNIDVSETHFMSKEGSRHHDYPLFYKPCADGTHIEVARYKGDLYITQYTKSDYGKPIPFHHSGRG